jgi:hypothetical protein
MMATMRVAHEMKGYRVVHPLDDVQEEKCSIEVNTSLTIDVTLQVQQASQPITVTESAAAVHTTDTQFGQTIESKQIVDIPLNGRSYTDLLVVQAGSPQ